MRRSGAMPASTGRTVVLRWVLGIAAVAAIALLSCRLDAALDADGWTVVQPSSGTIIYYVSSSQGDDANPGTSSAAPLRTVGAAVARLRDGKPDWLLFKRGDVWNSGL